MSAVHEVERLTALTSGVTMRVRVSDPAKAAELQSYLDRLGLTAVVGEEGTVAIRGLDGVRAAEARLEVESYIDAWIRGSGVPVQLG